MSIHTIERVIFEHIFNMFVVVNLNGNNMVLVQSKEQNYDLYINGQSINQSINQLINQSVTFDTFSHSVQ